MTGRRRREVFASISRPDVSVTPIMYNAAFRELGLDFVYVSFEVAVLAEAMRAMRALDIRGYSVSRPYKREVIPLLDEVDPTARGIGAVNVVSNRGGRLVGYNTDWTGAVAALAARTELRGRRAAVLGAGGAGRAVAYGLKAAGASVAVHNRTTDRARAVARELGVEFGGGLDAVAEVGRADIVVNATPIGCPSVSDPSGPAPSTAAGLLPVAALRAGQVVLDAVFNPVRTRFLIDAERAGCVTVPGIDMLAHQAATAFRIFTGQRAPLDVMVDALRRALGGQEGTIRSAGGSPLLAGRMIPLPRD